MQPVRVLSIATSLVLALGGCGTQKESLDVAEPVELQILGINDFHGNLEAPHPDIGGAAWLTAHLRNAEATAPHTAIVSAGDLVGASPLISSLFHDEPAIEAANLWGLDFAATGNHEFDEGREELLRLQDGGAHPIDGNPSEPAFAGASFWMLAANVVVDEVGEPLFPPYAIEKYDGIPVAFIGLPLEDTPSVVLASGVEGLSFEDEADTINKYVAEVRRQGVEAIVVVVHQGGYPAAGSEDDCNGFSGPIVDIVQDSDPAVDLFVTGHTHKAYLCLVDGRPVTSAGYGGQYYTDIEVRLDRESGDMTVLAFDNVPVTHEVAPAADVLALVQKYRAEVEAVSKAVVGTITGDFSKTPDEVGATQLGGLIADAQLAATEAPELGGAVVAFMNAGGVRTDLRFEAGGDERDGAVTFAEIAAAQPFGNILVTMTLSGAQIHTLLEQQWQGQSAEMLMPSEGFTYTWSRSAPDGQRVDPSSIRIGGVVVDPSARYRVTVNSFLAGGGDGFPVLREGTDRLEGIVDIEALKLYFAARSPMTPLPLDRIRVVP
jgi:5'-nucleotidase